ncbi:hypothetical protein RCL1_004725 [Eukaryota sp. TZLM3-RCL]
MFRLLLGVLFVLSVSPALCLLVQFDNDLPFTLYKTEFSLREGCHVSTAFPEVILPHSSIYLIFLCSGPSVHSPDASFSFKNVAGTYVSVFINSAAHYMIEAPRGANVRVLVNETIDLITLTISDSVLSFPTPSGGFTGKQQRLIVHNGLSTDLSEVSGTRQLENLYCPLPTKLSKRKEYIAAMTVRTYIAPSSLKISYDSSSYMFSFNALLDSGGLSLLVNGNDIATRLERNYKNDVYISVS